MGRTLTEMEQQFHRLEPYLTEKEWSVTTCMMLPSLLAASDELHGLLLTYQGPDADKARELALNLRVMRADFESKI
jgi:hypothetical protein